MDYLEGLCDSYFKREINNLFGPVASPLQYCSNIKVIYLKLIVFLFSAQAWAYPDFISYGYNTCISCHFNSHGYGPLTDYGRALFSQEIAARNFWTPKSVADEEIAEKSGFVPGVELPYWVRPGIKYRGLYLKNNPGSVTESERWIRMQRDFNLVLSADEGYRTVLVGNIGLLHEPEDYYDDGKEKTTVSREYYIRFFPLKKLLFSAGLMDIAYGIRTGDHTSVSRGALGLGQDDQVHGVLTQWFENSWDATLHVFAGNLHRDEAVQRKGFSVQTEYLTSEFNKVGFSILQSQTETTKSSRVAIHNRHGISKAPGSSLIVEVGLKQDETEGSDKQEGAYFMGQTIIHLTRGYNLISGLERFQDSLGSSTNEFSRWTLGFLLFPLQRTELRLTMVQGKLYSPTFANNDFTQFQGQIHVSW